MQVPAPERRRARFGPFDADLTSHELRNDGSKIKLQEMPFEVLAILLEQPGALVTREELRQSLWPSDTFVDFEHSINTAVKKLREALEDDADQPRYIETLPKLGYRFIGAVEAVENSVTTPANGQHASVQSPPETESAVAPEAAETGPSVDEAVNPQPAPGKRRHEKAIAAAVAIVLAISAGALYWLHHPRTPFVTSIHQLTTTGHSKAWLATDGTRVYFVEWFGGRGHLAQVSTKGGDVSYIDIPLITNPEISDISDDACQLLVGGETAKFEDPTWVFPLPNGPARRIPGQDLGLPKFLPGNKEVVYLLSSDRTRLFTVKLDGGEAHAVLSAPGSISNFAISHDGQRTRFSVEGKMWESRLDGSGLHRFLPQRQEPILGGQWSPDGRTYTFLSQDQDGPNLWAVTESELGPYRLTSRPVQLTFFPNFFWFWTPSKDGKQIFVLGDTRRGELSAYDAGSGQFQSYLNGISAAFVDFSRDGQWVTYVAYPEGALWRSRLDGTQRQQLTFSPIHTIVNPRWSPDGRLIAFMEWGDTHSKIYVVPADGGSPMLLLAGAFFSADPTWSPDGRSLAYGGAADHESDIRILNLDTKQSKTIPGSQHMYSPRWSPDGRYIAAQSDDSTKLFLYNFEKPGWKQVPLPTLPKPGYVEWPAWSHDSRSLYVISSKNVLKIPVPDGRVELAASINGFDITGPFGWGWFGLTPDDRVVVLRDRGVYEVYTLDLKYR